MYLNGKMRPVETVPRIEEGVIKQMMEGMNSILIYCKNFCKRHNVCPIQK
jgi:hypothetical protein